MFGTDLCGSLLKYSNSWKVTAKHSVFNNASAADKSDRTSYTPAASYAVMDTGLEGLNSICQRAGAEKEVAKIFVVGAKYEAMGFMGALTFAEDRFCFNRS